MDKNMTSLTSHKWRFFRVGGFDQVKLETGADLLNLDQLDQKLWVALACPTTGLEFDPKTLALIDTDKDGRIRAPELIGAVKWACSMLKNPDDLVKGGDTVAFSAINDSTPEGSQLLASAKQICINLGKKDATAITLADTSDIDKIFSNTTFNGDGVITAESSSDDETRAVITEIALCMGTVTDRSGNPGIDQAKADAFFSGCEAFDDWIKKAETNADEILPANKATASAFSAVKAIKTKVDDYFGRCRLASYDQRAADLLNPREEEYKAVATGQLSINAAEFASFPLSWIAPGKPLPLRGSVNPAHAEALAELNTKALVPLLGYRNELTEADWAELQDKLGAFERWNAEKILIPADIMAGLEKLGIERVREILGSKARENVTELISRDKSLEFEANSIAGIEKLCRYVRDIHKLCLNFVSFHDFYGRKEKAIFQAGTLYIDQRSCDLCLKVEDSGKHATMVGMAGAYLAYCDCVRKETGEQMQIVTAFTGGDSENLMVGRNGIFYDRKGRDWDATITKIINNPISIRQAFWAPYKKIARIIEEQIAKRALTADAAVSTKLQTAATGVVAGDKVKPADPAKKIDTGTLAAIGLVMTTLLAALGGIFSAFLRLPGWQIPLAVIGLLLAISIPSMILAWLKLQKRNLGPILDANGWALNTRAKINVPLGSSLTQTASLPPGSQRDLIDPFAEKKSPWPKIIVILIILMLLGYLLHTTGLLQSLTAPGK